MTYININALDIQFETAEAPALSFEDWAKKNDLYFVVTELEAMDHELHRGTHKAQVFREEEKLSEAYGDGVLEALLGLAKECLGKRWGDVLAPTKFRGI